MVSKKISIAIDGPAAAGKSTVAKIIAQKLSYIYVDTGAMYRSLTWKALREHVDLENQNELYDLLKKTEIKLVNEEKQQKVYVDRFDVTEEIRRPDVTKHVSIVSKHELVRKEMVRRQQEIGKRGGVIMDGRDIGTHVMPNAEVKIFLLASVDERAERRHRENIEKGIESNLEQIKKDIAARDKLDTEREIAPLRKAEDAIEIDTTSLSIDEVAEKILAIIQERIG
ncbi:(d)CMP kinase [Pallidibacillus pasinlerensis]|uniref:Cytidylate kinase n=1 Tax=Pallidibacillus pasinlerensis TaxID=2703818 RepID=A0ABX0A304_9BACI|nr:(d)CMP kinase [Pallidibacillus pasinlerensis]NCU16364.1 (d)CMP kinase [Pallidibacillus pasinlerensis]